jgi:hypothetical protein
MLTVLLLSLILSYSLIIIHSQCHNRCNGHGTCGRWNNCECFEGYSGPDCARRDCPTGPAFVDTPSSATEAHAPIVCSGKGLCNYNTGLCKCFGGYSGLNCAKTRCFNDCSGHGQCLSLSTAASENDGYNLNHTTSYDLWDGNLIFGCNCEIGYSGADCSQRVCEYGVDPRLSDLTHEIVTFVCQCHADGCGGRFKLKIFGQELRSWLTPTSTTQDLLKTIITSSSVFQNSSILNFPSIDSPNQLYNQTICRAGNTIKTKIRFRRNYGDIGSPLMIFANAFRAGSVYFEVYIFRKFFFCILFSFLFWLFCLSFLFVFLYLLVYF